MIVNSSLGPLNCSEYDSALLMIDAKAPAAGSAVGLIHASTVTLAVGDSAGVEAICTRELVPENDAALSVPAGKETRRSERDALIRAGASARDYVRRGGARRLVEAPITDGIVAGDRLLVGRGRRNCEGGVDRGGGIQRDDTAARTATTHHPTNHRTSSRPPGPQ